MQGKHLIIDFYDCQESLFNNGEVFDALQNAALAANQTIVGKMLHEFPEQGCSAVLVLCESHSSVHTWPELKTFTFDLYTCGNTDRLYCAAQYLKAKFRPNYTVEKTIERGNGFIKS